MMAHEMSNAAIDSLNERVAQLAQTWRSRDKTLGDTAEDLCHALTPILMKLDLLATVAELPVGIRPNWVVAELTDLRGQAEDCVQRSVAAIRAVRQPAAIAPGDHLETAAQQQEGPGCQNPVSRSVAMASGAMASGDDPGNRGEATPAKPGEGTPMTDSEAELAALRQTVLGITEELTEPLTVLANYLVASRSLLHRVDPSVSSQMFYAIEEAYAQALRAGTIVKRLRRSVMTSKAR